MVIIRKDIDDPTFSYTEEGRCSKCGSYAGISNECKWCD